MLVRQIGKLLRGKATPFQLVAACVLGSQLGFAPAVAQAPALYLLLVGALLVVNANLGLALLVAGATTLLSWIAAPVSFALGRFLLDGPTSDLAHAVVNAPFLAWCGLHYYAVAGGQLLAIVLGLVAGFVVASGVARFRRRMVAAAASENPSRWRELSEKRWARALLWLFFGGTGRKTWEEKLGPRVGNPVRISGVVLVALVGAGLWFAHGALAGPLARRGLETGLERANGATVDVGDVRLDLRQGFFGVEGLALADPNALERDLLRANELAADVDQVDFLRRQVHLAKLVVRDAASGVARETPGERVDGVAETAGEVAERAREKAPDLEDLTLEDVIEEVELWRGRLSQARRWLERLAPEPEEAVDDETFSERLARRAREAGWLRVPADHLIDGAPTFRLSALEVDGLVIDALPGRLFDVRGSELSTQPWLVDAPPTLALASRDGSIRFEVDLGPASRGGGPGGVRVHWKGLSVDETLAHLRLPGGAPLTGGTLDLEIDGSWAGGEIGHVDLPLRVTFHDTTLQMEGIERTELEELVLPIGLSGPIDAPRIHFDGSTFADALAEAGRGELARRVRGELEEKLEKAGVKVPEDVEERVREQAGGLLDDVLGGGKKKKKEKDDDGGR